MALIDKDALVAEIKRRIKEIDEIGTYLSPKGVLTNLLCHINTLEVKEADLKGKEDVNSIIERIDDEIDRLLFNNGREIDYEDVIQMIRREIRTIRNEIKAQKGE